MGVKGLWKLLEPCGRRIHVETLENTTLAVDVSIWMTQFVKAMRDEEGRPIKNAHVIGTLRRVAKLLYHGVRPVIVFDGGVPALKERLIRQRRMRRERREDDARSTAKRLLAARLESRGAPPESSGPKYGGGLRGRLRPGEPGRGRTYKGAGAAPRAHATVTRIVVGRRRRRLRVGARRDRGRFRGGGRRRRERRRRRGAHRPAARRPESKGRGRQPQAARRRAAALDARGRGRGRVLGDAALVVPAGRDVPAARRAGPGRAGRRRRARRAHPLDPKRRFVLLRDDENGQQVRGGVKARMERFLQANDEEVVEEEDDDDDAPPTCAACGRRKSRCACALRHGACARRPAPRPRPTPQTVVPLPGQSIDEALEEAELRYVEDFPEEFVGMTTTRRRRRLP